MKFVLLLLISFNLFASNTSWMDLEKDSIYKLEANIQLNTNNGVSTLEKGRKLLLNDIIGLDFVRVTIFETFIQNCEIKDQESELEVFDFSNDGELTVIGYELHKDCKLDLFLENIDLSRKSILGSN